MMNSWTPTTIGEQATLQRGFDITKDQQRAGTIPVVSSAGVSSYHDTPAASGPGVVLGRKGVVGSVYYIPSDYWPHDTTLWVKDFHGNDRRFVYYFFKSMASRLASMDVGSANPTLNRNHIHPISVHWPSLPEQRRIAEVLGNLDDKIALNARYIMTLKELARVQAKVASRRCNLQRLDSIAELQRGFGYRSTGFGSGGMPMISMGSAERRGWLKRSGIRYYVEPIKEKYLVRPWDILVVNVDLTWKLDVLGWPLIVPADLPLAAISNDVFAVRFAVPGRAVRVAVWAHLQTPSARSLIEGVAKGTTVASISPADLLALEVPVPSGKSETDRLNYAADLIERAWLAEREAAGISSIRDTLLPRLVSGDLDLAAA